MQTYNSKYSHSKFKNTGTSMLKTLPLDGITVVSLEHAIAAPFCTRQLAEQGARVIKIERPDGGDFARHYDDRANGLSSHFVWVNRSKESLTLDIKSAEGKKVLFQILKKSDVLIQNLGPSSTDRLGLSHEALKDTFPTLIVCGISGYGRGGSYADKKAYDLLIQSESGFLSITGDPSHVGMAKAGCSIADIAAGMYAYTNILSALIQRHKTGVGCDIDISMLEAMIEWMGYPLYYTFDGASPPQRSGASHASISPYGPYIASDNKVIILGVQNKREWERFCVLVLRSPDLLTDKRFVSNAVRNKNKDSLNLIITDIFSTQQSGELIKRLDQAQIANATINQMSDVWEHQQLKDRGRWISVESSVGPIPALLPPGVNDKDSCSILKIPALGEHSQRILSELGYSISEIDSLKQKRVI
jgi:itaconate CoA-transferase